MSDGTFKPSMKYEFNKKKEFVFQMKCIFLCVMRQNAL